LGGKYTTFRRMAQDLCRELVPRLGVSYNPNRTLEPLRRASIVGTFENTQVNTEKLHQVIRFEKVRTFDDLVHRRLSWLNPTESMKELAGQSREYWEKEIQK